jgi:hypothetical protein
MAWKEETEDRQTEVWVVTQMTNWKCLRKWMPAINQSSRQVQITDGTYAMGPNLHSLLLVPQCTQPPLQCYHIQPILAQVLPF